MNKDQHGKRLATFEHRRLNQRLLTLLHTHHPLRRTSPRLQHNQPIQKTCQKRNQPQPSISILATTRRQGFSKTFSKANWRQDKKSLWTHGKRKGTVYGTFQTLRYLGCNRDWTKHLCLCALRLQSLRGRLPRSHRWQRNSVLLHSLRCLIQGMQKID